MPALRAKTIGQWVVARHARGGGHPEKPLPVDGHPHDPVVAEFPAHGVLLLKDGMVAQRTRLRVVDAEAVRESGDVEASVIVAGHVEERVTVVGHLQLRGACQRVVGIEAIVSAHPVASLAVAVDEFHGVRSLRMGHHTALVVETVDTHVLNGAPRHAVIAGTDRPNSGA